MIPSFWVFFLPGLALGLYAQWRLSSVYGRYLQESLGTGVSGAEAAREILDRAGLDNVPVEEVPGHLTDHYDPIHRRLCLSGENYHGRSIAAVGVAAHEAGHALQHQAAYLPLHLRMAMVPITQFASNAVYWIALLGMILGITKLFLVAVILFSVVTFFQLITLPVEFDASRRAKAELIRLGLVSPSERSGVAKVLNAAALTYVAAMVQSLLTLLHYAMLARGRDRS
jgi:uncharacterized protein